MAIRSAQFPFIDAYHLIEIYVYISVNDDFLFYSSPSFYKACEIDIKGPLPPHLFMWQDKELHFSLLKYKKEKSETEIANSFFSFSSSSSSYFFLFLFLFFFLIIENRWAHRLCRR